MTPDLEQEYHDAHSHADRLGRRLYRENVEACVDALLDYDDGTDLGDAVHEVCDGDAWVVYAAKAADVLRFSDNDEAWRDLWPECPRDASQRAYAALTADVRDLVHEHDPRAETVGDLRHAIHGDEEE